MSRRSIEAGQAFVRGTYDGSQLDAGLANAQRRLKRFASQANRIGRRALVTGGLIAAIATPTIAAASKAEETMSKFNTVFGENATAAKAWSDDLAKAIGRGKTQVASFVGNTQDLFVPLGFAADEATRLSKEVTTLAFDLASFNNMQDADTIRDLHAALTGSGEVMKKYGVVLSEAAVKQELLNQKMDPKLATNQQKVQARLNIILAGTTAAQGDALRTAGSFANQMKALEGRVDDAASSLGSNLLPVVTPVVTQLAHLAEATGVLIAANPELSRTVLVLGAGVGALGVTLVTVGSVINGVSATVGVASTALGWLSGMVGNLSGNFGGNVAAGNAASTTIVGYTVSTNSASRALAVLNTQVAVFNGHLRLTGTVAASTALALPGVAGGITMINRATMALQASWAFLAANPIGTIFAGVAIIWGVVRAVQALSSASEDLNDNLQGTVDKVNAAVTADAKKLARLEELAGKQKRTNAETREANKLLTELEATYGALGASVDPATGKFVGLAGAIETLTMRFKELRREALKTGIEKAADRIEELGRPIAAINLPVVLGADGLPVSGTGGRDLAAEERERLRRTKEIAKLEAQIVEFRKQYADLSGTGTTGGPGKGPDGSVAAPSKTIEEQRFDKFSQAMRGAALNRFQREAEEKKKADEKAAREAERMADRERARQESIADHQKDLDYEIARERIKQTKKGLDQELALLDLRYQQERDRLADAGLLTDAILERLGIRQGLERQALIAGDNAVSRTNNLGTFNGQLAGRILGEVNYAKEAVDVAKEQLEEQKKTNVALEFLEVGGGILIS